MLVTTDDVIAAWLSPSRQLSIRVKVNDVTYGSEDITSLSFDSGSISGETYQIGSTYMNSIQIIFPSLIETVKEDMEVVPELGVLVNGTYKYTKLGHFFIDEFERNRNNNTTTIRATDKMRFMEGPYESKLSYQKPYREVALEVANLAGVEINEASFSALGTAAINKPEGYTFRQAIGLIAQFEGGFASFNRNGELEIRRLAPTNFEITPESYMLKGFTKNEVSYRIGGITVKTGEEETDVIRVGSTNGSQVQLENRVMTQQLLNQTWELVKDLNYFPFELKWRGCPPLEAGDWIYVTANDGTKYSVPNLSYSITFNGGMSAESKATTSSSSQATYKYRGPLNQRIDYLDSILSSNNWNSNYYDSTEPPNPKEGDVWFKPNGKDTEIWVYKNVEGVLDWVMEITSAGDPELLAAIEKAKDEAEKAQNAANTAVNKANEAVAKVDSMDKAVNTALEQSASAIDQAQQAIKDANNLLTTVTEVQGTVTNISTVVDEINNQLAVKVSQTDFDKLKGTVDTQAVQISANAAEIALKASQSSVNTITGNVESIQSELKTQAGSITAINTKVEGNTTHIGTLQSSYNGLSSTIANVQNDFLNSDYSNIISNSKGDSTKGYVAWNDAKFSSDGSHITINKGTGTTYGILTDFLIADVEEGVTYTLQVDVSSFYNTTALNYTYLIYADNQGNQKLDDVPVFSSSASFYTKQITFKPVRSGKVRLLLGVNLGPTPNSTGFRIKNLMIFKGVGKQRVWIPAYTDMATITEMSNITQTVKDIQLTVADKVSQSQFTILSNQVTTTVSDISNLGDKLDLTDIKARMAGGLFVTDDPEFRKGNNGLSVYNNAQNGVVTLIRESTGSTATQPTNSNTRMRITVTGAANPQFGGVVRSTTARINAKFVVRFIANLPTGRRFQYANNSLGTNGKCTWLTSYEGTGTWTEYMYLVECGSGGTFSSFGHLYVLNGATPTSESPLNWYIARYEIIDITQSQQSQITQLSDSINLRVEKNDVVNQINISTEGVLIAGKKIQITGETYIANAVIKTANIADLAITNTKIADATISSAKIINLDASKVSANNLAAITTDTGTLNVSGYLNILNQNTGMYGTYDYGDSLTGSYNPRWYTGSWRIGNNLFRHTAEIYSLTSSGGKGTRQGYFETSYGSDYVAMRKYNNSTSMTMSARIDINSDRLQVSDSWNETSGVILSANGEMSASEVRSRGAAYLQSTLDVAGAAYLRSNVDISGGLITRSTVDLQGSVITRSRFEFQGSLWLTGDSYINSMPTYNRTTSSAANLMVTSNGYFARSTSARKYKAEIEVASDVIAKAKKVLEIQPSSWFDKAEMARGEAQNRYFGFIADEFHQMDLKEVVLYGAEGQIESLAYDRISIYHNVILTEHEKEINRLKKQVELLESQVRVLQAA